METSEKRKVTLTIDEVELAVPAGTTIMQAADQLKIHIPRLCYHPDLAIEGACRVCIVEVAGFDHYLSSCCVEVWPGMQVRTCSPVIRRARRDLVELLLDNHPQDCQICERDGNCELQKLAYTMGVRERLFAGRRKRFPKDESGAAVVRDAEKCILCGRCIRVCRDIQGVYNLSQHHRGFHTVVGPADLAPMDESVCIQCGQCINVCPTAAFLEQPHTNQAWEALADPCKHVVVQTAPAIRAAIGEGFGLDPGTPCTGQMITALRRLGFDAVFDTNFGADLTIMEEGTELVQRIRGSGPLPMLTSCSPGWINFLEKFYPELIPNVSSCKSPLSILSTLTKTWYAEQVNIDPVDIYMVAVMPCVAKKYEAARPEHRTSDGRPVTDAVLTTRELIWMIKCFGIEFAELPAGEFDHPLGLSTGAADIFGATGGVMEAALRTAGFLLQGERRGPLAFEEVRREAGLRESLVRLDEHELRVAVADGLVHAKEILDAILRGEGPYHLVEIMACPGGCIGGGGQPYPRPGSEILDHELLHKRRAALFGIDSAKQLRRAHENPAIREVYERFLGEPGGPKAHELLHTSYHARTPRGIR